MKKKISFLRIMVLSIPLGLILNSCATVKPYQKMYLNDAEMVLSIRKAEKFEQNFLLYREGSSGANGSKSGGGCGCN
ncbi:MAG: DUF4266 domain-containing protein [Bacteroidia bacterium]|nr:DUF4266 domain-containing protein [Bacteroidia bacterium]